MTSAEDVKIYAAGHAAALAADIDPDLSPEAWADKPLFSCKLEDVRHFLEGGLKEFRRGAELKDGGRLGMQRALTAALFMLGSQLVRRRDHELLTPLMTLSRALDDLDTGGLHPAFLPRRSGRPAAGTDVVEFKGRCLAAADVLHRHALAGSHLPRREADLAVAKRMHVAATRLGIRMTDKSLATWRRDARKATNKGGLPTTLFVWVQAAQGMGKTCVMLGWDPKNKSHYCWSPFPAQTCPIYLSRVKTTGHNTAPSVSARQHPDVEHSALTSVAG